MVLSHRWTPFNVGPFSGIAFLKFGMMKFWSLWLEKQETGSQVASRKKGPKWLYKNRPFFFGGLGGSPNFGTYWKEYRNLNLSQVTNIYAYISDGDSTYTTGIRAQWNTVFGTVQVPGSGQTYWEVEVTSLGLLPEFANALYCLYHFTSFYICLYQLHVYMYVYILVSTTCILRCSPNASIRLKNSSAHHTLSVLLSCGRYRQSWLLGGCDLEVDLEGIAFYFSFPFDC